jgi:hypothetical protein
MRTTLTAADYCSYSSLLLLLLLLPLLPPLLLPLPIGSAQIAILARTGKAIHKSLRHVKLGSGLLFVAHLAALAGHLHSNERPLALLVVCAVAFNAFVLQPVEGATKARCCQKPFTLAALLFLRHLALPAAVGTLPARTACQAGACPAAFV